MTETQIHNQHASKYSPNFSCFAAPGRINIIGEHTDYNLGYVLPASINKRIYLAISPSPDGLFHITAKDFNQTVDFNADTTPPTLPHWAKYPYGVIKEFESLGHKPEPFCATFGGDIPEGAGLSSSAALESVFALAINTLNSLNLNLEQLAKIGQSAEHNYASVKCGIMDQFASLFGKANHVIRLDCRSLNFELVPFNLPGYELVLADTKVKHSLASSEYNVRRAQCEEGVSIIANGMPEVKSLRDATPEIVAKYSKQMSTDVHKRCQYVVEENLRLLDACNALTANDPKTLGQLMNGSHKGLKELYEVSCPELDKLVNVAATVPGVYGARMMGGGFGGCTINLIESSAVESFISSAEKQFESAFGSKPSFYRVTIDKGASSREPVHENAL